MTEVRLRDGESIESALKRFNKAVTDSRILVEVRERREYRKPSEVRRRDAAAGKARCMKKQRKTEKYLEYLDSHKFPPRRSGSKRYQDQQTQQRPQRKYQKSIYVGGIPYSSTEDSLQKYIETVAPVYSVKIILDRETGKSKGFGFINLASESDLEKVVNQLNGKDFEGRRLVLNINDSSNKKSQDKDKKESRKPSQSRRPNVKDNEEEEDSSFEDYKANVG